MAKKRTYDLNNIRTEYEDTLEQQEKRELAETTVVENTFQDNQHTMETSSMSVPLSPIPKIFDEDYINPDKEDYKRMSLFMDWEVWERIQAMCWSENEAVNKVIVDKLREWSLDVSDETLEAYHTAMKQKHLDEWAEQRDVIQYWWNTSGLREQMQIQSYRMNRNSLTVIENTGSVRNYYIHRGWITDGQNKLAREKSMLAQMKRTT